MELVYPRFIVSLKTDTLLCDLRWAIVGSLAHVQLMVMVTIVMIVMMMMVLLMMMTMGNSCEAGPCPAVLTHCESPRSAAA